METRGAKVQLCKGPGTQLVVIKNSVSNLGCDTDSLNYDASIIWDNSSYYITMYD